MDYFAIISHLLFISIMQITKCEVVYGDIYWLTNSNNATEILTLSSIVLTEGSCSFFKNYLNGTNGVSMMSLQHGLPIGWKSTNTFLSTTVDYPYRQMENNSVNTQYHYLYFTNSFVSITSNIFNSTSNGYSVITGQTIVDAIFANSIIYHFAVLQDTVSQRYKLAYYKIATSKNKTTLNYNLTCTHIKAAKNSANIFILFKEGILVHSANSAMTFVKEIAFANLSANPQMHVNGTLLAYSNDNTFRLVSTVDYTQVLNYTMPSTILGITLTQYYVIVHTNSLISQHDISLNGAKIHSLYFNYSNSLSMQMTLGQFLLFSASYPVKVKQFPVYHFDGNYPSYVSCGCIVGYNLSKCIKNYSFIVTSTINRTLIESSIPTGNCTINNLNITNNTSNQNTTQTQNTTKTQNTTNNNISENNISNISITNNSVTNFSNLNNTSNNNISYSINNTNSTNSSNISINNLTNNSISNFNYSSNISNNNISNNIPNITHQLIDNSLVDLNRQIIKKLRNNNNDQLIPVQQLNSGNQCIFSQIKFEQASSKQNSIISYKQQNAFQQRQNTYRFSKKQKKFKKLLTNVYSKEPVLVVG